MKSGVPTLYPNDTVGERVSIYSEEHSTALPSHIIKYHDWVDKNDSASGLMISNFQGQCLTFLAHLVGAKRVLEVGVYIGYSSLVWSHAVGEDGAVTGLEYSPEYAATARRVFGENGVKNVDVIEGDGLQTLPALNPTEPYDLIFIDAQKSGYPDYLRTILEKSPSSSDKGRLLRKGGLIIADNVLRKGIVADESDDNPHAVANRTNQVERTAFEQARDLTCMREFNDLMVKSERLETFLMSLYDGMSIARLLD